MSASFRSGAFAQSSTQKTQPGNGWTTGSCSLVITAARMQPDRRTTPTGENPVAQQPNIANQAAAVLPRVHKTVRLSGPSLAVLRVHSNSRYLVFLPLQFGDQARVTYTPQARCGVNVPGNRTLAVRQALGYGYPSVADTSIKCVEHAPSSRAPVADLIACDIVHRLASRVRRA